MSISKTWTFTKNNWTFEDVGFFIEWPEFTYMVFGREVAPTTGTPHLQGYFTLLKAVRPSYLKRVLPQGTHFEIARKSELANTRYCIKSCNYTVIDRRRGRPGIPRPVTVQDDLPGHHDQPVSESQVGNLFQKLQPNFHLNIPLK